MTTDAPRSHWGRRAAALYTDEYARRYRDADAEIRDGALVARFGDWLAAICESFGREIVALDLGCGTGRYFRSLRQVRALVGIDVSAAMLSEAREPLDSGSVRIGQLTLTQGDFLTIPVEPGRFDLVYAIGVLGEHVPLDLAIAQRAHAWLVEDGRFAFTAVHRESFSVPRTVRRRAAERLVSLPGPLGRALRRRLLSGGLYVDEAYIAEVLHAASFEIESVERYESGVHLHCLCVARKGQSGSQSPSTSPTRPTRPTRLES